MVVKKKSKRWIYISIVIVSVLIFGMIAKKKGWIGGGETVEVTGEFPQKRTITETITAAGKIYPVVEVKISPDVSGEIVELPVKEGDEVKKGQLLLRIEPDNYAAALEQVKASLNTTRADYAQAKSNLAQAMAQFKNDSLEYVRNQNLFKEGVISLADMQKSETAYQVSLSQKISSEQAVEAAYYRVESSKASMDQASQNLQKTSIYAPTDGVISKLNVELGERVVGTSQMAGTELLRIANLNNMEVRVDVNENDIVRINLGDSTKIEVDAYSGKTFWGKVSSIANSANITGAGSDQITNFEVKIKILASSYEKLMQEDAAIKYSPFRPGMSATVDIMTESVYNALSVPIQCVTAREMKEKKDWEKENKGEVSNKKGGMNMSVQTGNSQNEKKYSDTTNVNASSQEVVFIIKNGKVEMRKVKTGIADTKYFQILEGLTEQDEVVTGSYRAISKLLEDGKSIKKVKKIYEEEEEK